MGKALEWLGRDGCRSVFGELVAVDANKSNASRQWACCPFHSERTPSFSYRPDEDKFHCFGCKQSGDLIDLFEHLNGYAEGDGFMAFRERFAPDGRLDPRRESKPARPSGPPPWAPRPVQEVPASWCVKAESFVAHSQERLAANAETLEWLAGRGISAETAKACRLGWNDKDKYPPRSMWGLPKECNQAGRERKIWLPEGLVIPWARHGEIVKIKIRRPHPEDGPASMREVKYYGVRGNAGCFSVYGRPKPGMPVVAVVVESELDAVLLWQELRHLGVVILAAPAGSKPDRVETDLLLGADLVLLSLDVAKFELAEGDKEEKAGPMASAWFLEHFPNAVRRPVPPSMGKDHGEAVAAGLSMRDWFEAALPSHVRREIFRDRAVSVRESVRPPESSEDAGLSAASDDSSAAEAPLSRPNASNPVRRRRAGTSRMDGPNHLTAYKAGRSWILSHMDALLALGWTRRALFAAGRFRYPVGSWGLAWFRAWTDPKLSRVEIAEDGAVKWWMKEGDREVVQESRPKK
jgi:hypothetical protein